MTDIKTFALADEAALLALAGRLGSSLDQQAAATTIYMYGELGAGKTTFSRGLIQQLGHDGKVKSPTYTLVESYELPNWTVHHFDLYRLADPEELEFMGIRDYLSEEGSKNTLIVAEWPQRGFGYLPAADITITIDFAGTARSLTIKALTNRGKELLLTLN
ncbi:tRNA (adenosine(37)-N6)-threonylcarbamoyltransferase complex ATPase subunit type 1 TsaE [Pseudidiomarina aestuarii]|uniref:tRNA threonylcarbamoyladenosine biosynthesis protein TsaE n=3 Tax=Pseudidiomarina aestuarii TaxID=624146 RepID=A0A2T4D500_9GAMM|nr:tRNA (adenosine(37)-N6)-threonylcarbamoyltransferase complex ATPase subunit type 1 TsaE [Pseudidiomarina aestuarii]PTB84812.1 tRNA (adenosine(37)-N6)-threonylcarbamoyltransferase complex ATPase subunit type 1 TsaE [Pseudidiomarina aestuarii]PTB88879.1 tRNA (adenosine(37)-N6)-threonylcarbamoyltransferase complex ATPase subunit type 1 TsaE [Pseudidiomarina aestuarii]